MVKQVTISRDGETRHILLRQLPHDEQAIPGKKLKYGPGKKWDVLVVS